MTKQKHSIKHIAIVLGGLLAMAAGMVAWMQIWAPRTTNTPTMIATQQATLLPQLKTLPPFSLLDQQGRRFDNQRLRGYWTFLDFGYTHCPDVCPTTLALLADMDGRLRSSKQTTPYQIAFVSVDPERDTARRLAEYLDYFEPSFLGVRGGDQELQRLTRPLGILYQKVQTPNSAMGYVMDHSASIILIDPEGRYYALFSPPQDAGKMADDFIAITKSYTPSQ